MADGPIRESHHLETPEGNVPVHVVRLPMDSWQPRVVGPVCSSLEEWVRKEAPDDVAINGGFFVNEQKVLPEENVGDPLGDLIVSGEALQTWRFSEPWNSHRAVALFRGRNTQITWRDRSWLGEGGVDFGLQAGPLLLQSGEPVDFSREGFHQDAERFDCDITSLRAPRSALATGLDRREWILAVCEGYHREAPGLYLDEWAGFLQNLGAGDALNLDGGGSAAIIVDQKRLNKVSKRISGEEDSGRVAPTLISFSRTRKSGLD